MNQDNIFNLAYPCSTDISFAKRFPEAYDSSEFFGEGLFQASPDIVKPILD